MLGIVLRQGLGQMVELVAPDPPMTERSEPLCPLLRPGRVDQARDVPVHELGEAPDRPPDCCGVPDRERGTEHPGHLGALRVPGEGSEGRDRVVGDRPLERESRIERIEVLRKLGRRAMGAHARATPRADLRLRPDAPAAIAN